MFNAVWTASLRSLKTRCEVRGFLARVKADLTGDPCQQDLSAELSDLAMGSDREVMESYQYLDELCKGLSARDATYPRILVTRNVRDLLAKGAPTNEGTATGPARDLACESAEDSRRRTGETFQCDRAWRETTDRIARTDSTRPRRARERGTVATPLGDPGDDPTKS